MIRPAGMAAAVALAAPLFAHAAPLDDALALVHKAHPVLQAHRSEYRETTRQRDWSSDITLGWTQRGTTEGGAAGANAGIRVTIPLFDRSHELRSATARSAWVEKRALITTAFMAALAELETLSAAALEAETMRDFYRDQLEYRQRQVEEGISEPDTLWSATETAQRTEMEYQKAQQALNAARDRVAREYGGRQWMTLRDLLAAHTTPTLH
ncbi:TolC family protein [Halomonas garicola]|uniref:TolC family protein n=1 Tax=Halomonas garicola TaxID=1690008 RepID=UPI00289C8072|nr:TolC family protein [Halomonas garicola]